jgi:formyl-CoA transferase
VASPVWIEGQEKVPPRFAPAVGEHTVEVLRAAGFADAEIERLRRAGVIVQAGL